MKRSRWVLILCIVAAFFLWVVYTLSNEYTAYFRFPLEVETNLYGRSNLSQADNTVFLRGKTRGFYIIHYTWRKKIPTLRIFAVQALIHKYPDRKDKFYLLAGEINNLVNDALGTDFQLETILSDTIRLEYREVHYRKVPVHFVSDVSYAPQYMSFEPVRIFPDSVLVYAEEPYFDLIGEVRTRKVSLSDLNRTVEGIAHLETPANARLSHNEINYEVMVTRYVELSTEVPVTTRNVPYRTELLLLPEKVILQYRCPFEDAGNITDEDFSLVVDYNDFIEKKGGKITPSLERAPVVISHVQLTPQYVDGIIQNRY